MSDIKLQHCSFCGAHKDEVKKLIVGTNVAICSDCIDLCNQLIIDDRKDQDSDELEISEVKKNYDAYEIMKHLDSHVIGQKDAKKVLSVAIANHYKRINNPPKDSDLEISKGNVLLIGPTGSGKTLLAKTVAKYLNVPFVVADATSLTEAGYVGDDVESMISTLLTLANGDVELAERGIVFIDEVDKISRKSESASITRDVSGEGVQQALLKLVEGTKCRVPASGKRKNPQSDMVEVDTKNILFIAGGSFVGLSDIIKHRTTGSSLGFGATVQSKNQTVDIKQTTPEDLTKFGMIPEFIGRFATTISLEELTESELISILTDVKSNFIQQYQYLFGIDSIELTFSKDAIAQVAQNCISLKTGARGLQSELEKVLMPHMFHSYQYKKQNITKINIDADLVINPKPLIDV